MHQNRPLKEDHYLNFVMPSFLHLYPVEVSTQPYFLLCTRISPKRADNTEKHLFIRCAPIGLYAVFSIRAFGACASPQSISG